MQNWPGLIQVKLQVKFWTGLPMWLGLRTQIQKNQLKAHLFAKRLLTIYLTLTTVRKQISIMNDYTQCVKQRRVSAQALYKRAGTIQDGKQIDFQT